MRLILISDRGAPNAVSPLLFHGKDAFMVHAEISVQDLRSGQMAEVLRVVGGVDHVHRLEELGLSGGSVIQIFRSGNPCIIRTHGNKLCLRADRNLDVRVRLLTQEDDASSRIG